MSTELRFLFILICYFRGKEKTNFISFIVLDKMFQRIYNFFSSFLYNSKDCTFLLFFLNEVCFSTLVSHIKQLSFPCIIHLFATLSFNYVILYVIIKVNVHWKSFIACYIDK